MNPRSGTLPVYVRLRQGAEMRGFGRYFEGNSTSVISNNGTSMASVNSTVSIPSSVPLPDTKQNIRHVKKQKHFCAIIRHGQKEDGTNNYFGNVKSFMKYCQSKPLFDPAATVLGIK